MSNSQIEPAAPLQDDRVGKPFLVMTGGVRKCLVCQEAMRESGGTLAIRSELEDGRLVISVSHTGMGLPAEKVDQIFNAFFTTKPQGSGMGLAITRSIVESHGGRLWATANDGPGATFHFTLPIAAEALLAPTGT